MTVELIAITKYKYGTPEMLIERAGRICYASSGNNTESFVRARLQHEHESIIEHCSASFEISGISRACSHQLVRHRLASYSQRSQRYVDESGIELVMPDSVRKNAAARAEWLSFISTMKDTYAKLRKLGVLKEDARFVLPNAATTSLIMTANFREYLHMFRLRVTPEAQWEIRELCIQMLKLLAVESPTVFSGFLEETKLKHPNLI